MAYIHPNVQKVIDSVNSIDSTPLLNQWKNFGKAQEFNNIIDSGNFTVVPLTNNQKLKIFSPKINNSYQAPIDNSPNIINNYAAPTNPINNNINTNNAINNNVFQSMGQQHTDNLNKIKEFITFDTPKYEPWKDKNDLLEKTLDSGNFTFTPLTNNQKSEIFSPIKKTLDLEIGITKHPSTKMSWEKDSLDLTFNKPKLLQDDIFNPIKKTLDLEIGKEKSFSYSPIDYKYRGMKSREDNLNISFRVNELGVEKYNKLEKNSLFVARNLKEELRGTIKLFKIEDKSLIKGISLIDEKKYPLEFGSAYDYKKNIFEFNPTPNKYLPPMGQSSYELLTKENYIPHEFGHLKTLETYGKPSLLDDNTIWAYEHLADMVAKEKVTSFEFSHQSNLENDFLSPFRKNKLEDLSIGEIVYHKTQFREFSSLLEKEFDNYLFENILKKTNNDFNLTSNILFDIDNSSNILQEIGLNGLSRSKSQFENSLMDFRTNQQKIEEKYPILKRRF